jgi:N-acetylmuramic acid 6-phosphate (MurNAc-6-P) etherase
LTLASLEQNAALQFFAADIISGTTGNTGAVDASQALPPTSVPEPETYAMLLAGLGMMGFVARRRKQKAA